MRKKNRLITIFCFLFPTCLLSQTWQQVASKMEQDYASCIARGGKNCRVNSIINIGDKAYVFAAELKLWTKIPNRISEESEKVEELATLYYGNELLVKEINNTISYRPIAPDYITTSIWYKVEVLAQNQFGLYERVEGWVDGTYILKAKPFFSGYKNVLYNKLDNNSGNNHVYGLNSTPYFVNGTDPNTEIHYFPSGSITQAEATLLAERIYGIKSSSGNRWIYDINTFELQITSRDGIVNISTDNITKAIVVKKVTSGSLNSPEELLIPRQAILKM